MIDLVFWQSKPFFAGFCFHLTIRQAFRASKVQRIANRICCYLTYFNGIYGNDGYHFDLSDNSFGNLFFHLHWIAWWPSAFSDSVLDRFFPEIGKKWQSKARFIILPPFVNCVIRRNRQKWWDEIAHSINQIWHAKLFCLTWSCTSGWPPSQDRQYTLLRCFLVGLSIVSASMSRLTRLTRSKRRENRTQQYYQPPE